MQGYKYHQIMNPFFDMPSDYSEIVKVYRTLAKTADQRLVRLERYSEESGYGAATQYAYQRAARDIAAWDGVSKEKPRFNTRPPESKQELLAKIEDIKTFLSSESSTKKGLKDINDRRASTLNEKFGLDLKGEDLAEFFADGGFNEIMKERFAGSDTRIRSIATIRANREEILAAINKAKKQHKKVNTSKISLDSPDEVIERQIKSIISQYPSKVRKYLET